MLRIGGWSPSACSSLADLAELLLHTPILQFLLGFPQQLYDFCNSYALRVSRKSHAGASDILSSLEVELCSEPRDC